MVVVAPKPSWVKLMVLTMLVLVSSCGTGVHAVRLSEDTSLDTRTQSSDRNFCVAISSEKSACSTDPMKIRRMVDSPAIVQQENNVGVNQRIDGNDAEKKGIKEVLRLMNVYWHEEVLSNQDYEGVRTTW